MQTFLPLPDVIQSVRCLDRQRLGKQRVEAFQIISTLLGLSSGWRSHPAVLMWRGYTGYLRVYYNVCLREWSNRGYRNIKLKPMLMTVAAAPPWLGDPAFHASHRSNLLRKLPEWYAQFGWSEPPNLPYVWPITKE